MTNVSKEDQKTADDLFALFDKNKDGKITEKELRTAILGLRLDSPVKDELTQIYKECGVEKAGQPITKEQFTKTIMRYIQDNKKVKTKAEIEQGYRKAFKVFDRDGSGSVSRRELRKALSSLGEPLSEKELNELFNAADVNKDGKIQCEEYVRLFTGETQVPQKKKK